MGRKISDVFHGRRRGYSEPPAPNACVRPAAHSSLTAAAGLSPSHPLEGRAAEPAPEIIVLGSGSGPSRHPSEPFSNKLAPNPQCFSAFRRAPIRTPALRRQSPGAVFASEYLPSYSRIFGWKREAV